MPYNGAGVYSPPGADFPAVTQTVISSTHYNNVINDIATALSLTLTRDGQATVTGNIPFGGFRATNVGITGIAGSVGTPAINVSDAGTGLYRSAASELAVTVAGTQRGRFDATGLIVTGTVNASTSVVTPKVESAAAASITIAPEGTNRWTFSRLGTFPLAPVGDATQDIGTTSGRVLNLFATAVDSGTTGSLSLKTNNGTTGFQVLHTAGTVVNNFQVQGNVTTSGPVLSAIGTDTNVDAQYFSKGTGQHYFASNAGANAQFQVLHTASANRNITVTGSNGGNPTIGVTAGSLAITPAVVIAGASLQIGTNPASTAAAVGIPYNQFVCSRNQANGGDLGLVNAATKNSVTNIVLVGGSGSLLSGGVNIVSRSKAGAFVAGDFDAGEWGVGRDTSGATTKLYYNNAGTLMSVALA